MPCVIRNKRCAFWDDGDQVCLTEGWIEEYNDDRSVIDVRCEHWTDKSQHS